MLSSTVVSSAAGIISASKSWSKYLVCTLDMSILPLLIAFFAIVVIKVMEILYV